MHTLSCVSWLYIFSVEKLSHHNYFLPIAHQLPSSVITGISPTPGTFFLIQCFTLSLIFHIVWMCELLIESVFSKFIGAKVLVLSFSLDSTNTHLFFGFILSKLRVSYFWSCLLSSQRRYYQCQQPCCQLPLVRLHDTLVFLIPEFPDICLMSR